MLTLLPYEVLEDVAFWLADDIHHGHHYCSSSLSSLRALFLTNTVVHESLLGSSTLPNHAVLSRLFENHFDKCAFERRYRVKLTSAELAHEYKKRIGLLRRIHRVSSRRDHPEESQFDDYSHNFQALIDDLWTVLLIIYEDDGKNMKQLLHAGVEGWVTSLILYPNFAPRLEVDDTMWPIESELVRLSFAVISLVNTIESVEREDPSIHHGLLNAFHFFLIAPHQYTMFHYPVTSFRPGTDIDTHPVSFRLPAMGPASYSHPVDVEHFGRRLRLVSPHAVESALCATNLRRERAVIGLLPNTPENRADAEAQGRVGMTKEDYYENLHHRKQGLGAEVPHAGSLRERGNLACLRDPPRGSERFDIDFWRSCCVEWLYREEFKLSRCWFNTVYKVGIMTGKWFGRLQMPHFEDFWNMVQVHPMAPSVVDLVAQPMQFFLREHVTTDLEQSIGRGLPNEGDGVLNAWFPNGVDPSQWERARETATGLEVIDPNEPVPSWSRKVYQRVDGDVQLPVGSMPLVPMKVGEERAETDLSAGAQFPEEVESDIDEVMRTTGIHPDAPDEMLVEYDMVEDECVHVDVCLTGETGHNYGLAYGGYKIYGRVRVADGLVVFVRVPVNTQIGHGRWVFSCYLRASTTIVGQWRETGRGTNGIGYGGTFMMTKVGDSWGPPRR